MILKFGAARERANGVVATSRCSGPLFHQIEFYAMSRADTLVTTGSSFAMAAIRTGFLSLPRCLSAALRLVMASNLEIDSNHRAHFPQTHNMFGLSVQVLIKLVAATISVSAVEEHLSPRGGFGSAVQIGFWVFLIENHPQMWERKEGSPRQCS